MADLEFPELIDLHERTTFRGYWADVWARRWFIWRVPLENFKTEHSKSSLGPIWHFLNPLFLLAIYYVLFSVGLRANGTIKEFTTFLAIGIFFFRYSEQSALRSAGSITNNMPLILANRFPRMILPMSAVVTSLLYLLVGLIAVLVIALIDGARPAWTWFWVPVLIVVQSLFNLGLAAISARLGFRSQDALNFLPHLFTMLFYVSGVLFPVEQFFSERWETVFVLNPFFSWISLYRSAILDQPLLGMQVLWSVGIWTAVLLTFGVWFFRRAERDYGRAAL